MFRMDPERPDHQSADQGSPVLDSRVIDPRVIDPSTPLPSRCRTFRLSEIPLDMNKDALCQCLDSLQVGTGSMIKGNSKVFSLATYRSWQVATVSFHQESNEFERCKPGHGLHLPLPKRQVAMVLSHQEPDEYKRCKPDHEVNLRLPKRQVETRAVPVRVTVDCDFYNITTLYKPAETTVRYDIIAVTGLSAHAFGSWKSPDQADTMWLRDILHLEFPDIRVLTWGYYSSIKDERSTTSITAISRNFLEDVKRVREKEMLTFPCSAKGLNPKSSDSLVQGKGNKRFLKDLSTDSNYLFELEKDFRICHESMKNSIVVSFYESEDTCSVEKMADGGWKRCGAPIRMIPRGLAVCSVSKDCNRMEIRADHSRMVKFLSESDEHYQRVIDKIKEMTKAYEMRGVQERWQGGSAEISERVAD
ncbi:hypothetical protein FPQ18DRAFT_416352 [Pyronema domesticum]|nr:hypothetical protein FPQ18DRAFT_416352 [Pyronema domesticum]